MKDYYKDFKDKVEDESFSDGEIISIAIGYIRTLQKKVSELEKNKKEKKSDFVKIICYDQERTWNREEALQEFETNITLCEGSERDRYCSIVAGLKAGKKTVDDNWEWLN